MKIPNPWPWHQHTRCNVNNGECICVLPSGQELEVPDNAVEVVIEPVEKGRSDAKVIAQGRIWSKTWGLLDLEDHLKKMEMQKEEADLRKRQEKERKRREKEARERTGPKLDLLVHDGKLESEPTLDLLVHDGKLESEPTLD
jgi:hypothetical protein